MDYLRNIAFAPYLDGRETEERESYISLHFHRIQTKLYCRCHILTTFIAREAASISRALIHRPPGPMDRRSTRQPEIENQEQRRTDESAGDKDK